jgi:glyoxylase-like metal-dependent hydrolase (beta-lactamase superfamily II)
MDTKPDLNGIITLDTHYVNQGIAAAYLLESKGKYALIETGTAPQIGQMLAQLKSANVDLSAIELIVPTHVHLDHAGAVGHWANLLPHAKVFCHPRGLKHLLDTSALESSARAVYGEAFDTLYGTLRHVPEDQICALHDGESLALNGRVLLARHVRGHADHHLCIWDEQSRSWFTGDAFGISYAHLRKGTWPFSLPATTPTQFDPELASTAIDALCSVKPKWIYPTHFGRMPFDLRTAETLKSQLNAYAQLSAPEDALKAIQEITLEHLLTCMRRDTAEQCLTGLSADLELNSQGVVYRIQKLRQKRAQNHSDALT